VKKAVNISLIGYNEIMMIFSETLKKKIADVFFENLIKHYYSNIRSTR
jgi:hypothetical protein